MARKDRDMDEAPDNAPEGGKAGVLPPADGWSRLDRELSQVVVPLLRGVLYREDKPALWNMLLRQQARVSDYVAVLDLELVLDEAQGHAFLRSRDRDDQEEDGGREDVPRLVRRRQLSWPVSLLLALLRKKLAEFDAGEDRGGGRLVLSVTEVMDMVRIFLPVQSNEEQFKRDMKKHLKQVEEMGFVRSLRGQEDMLEVRRILATFVDAQWLQDLDTRLAEYRNHALQGATTKEDDDE